ncbi:MAG: hypothetical protein J5928_03960 [Firmicutes bacterium]|nr:hypothetical protein [Bacillota bacterium]
MISKIPNHRVLAINRGEKEGKLKVKLDVNQEDMTSYMSDKVIKGDSIFKSLLLDTVEDSYKRLIAPSSKRGGVQDTCERILFAYPSIKKGRKY